MSTSLCTVLGANVGQAITPFAAAVLHGIQLQELLGAAGLLHELGKVACFAVVCHFRAGGEMGEEGLLVAGLPGFHGGTHGGVGDLGKVHDVCGCGLLVRLPGLRTGAGAQGDAHGQGCRQHVCGTHGQDFFSGCCR